MASSSSSVGTTSSSSDMSIPEQKREHTWIIHDVMVWVWVDGVGVVSNEMSPPPPHFFPTFNI